MRLVLTVWKNRISPVADSARQILVVDAGNNMILDRRTESFESESVFHRAKMIADLGAEIFICGAISDFFSSLLEGNGIRLISFICGEVEEVLCAYFGNSLHCPEFMMKGYFKP